MRKRKRNNSFLFSFFHTKQITRYLRRKSRVIKSILLLVMGLSLIAIGGIHKIQAVAPLSFDGPVTVATVYRTSPPSFIDIPSISVSLPVNQTMIIKNRWEINSDGVSHLRGSANPGDTGNIILYGHNTLDRLGNLSKIKIGDRIYLKNKDSEGFEYNVVSIEEVNSTDIQKLTSFSGETVSIYTCTGFADLKRLLVKAKRVK